MDGIEEAVAPFRGTSVFGDLLTVWNYYRSIEHDFSEFESTFGIACPSRCGRCCERFIPDVTYLEALLIAFYLTSVKKEDISYLDGWSLSHVSCPLLDGSTKRCRAYAVRPIICRVFCSAASQTKNGLSFRGCHLSTDMPHMVREISDKELKASHIRIPVMSEYGEKIRQLQEWNTETKLLDEAVIDLSAKLELLRRILAESGDDDDFTPQAS